MTEPDDVCLNCSKAHENHNSEEWRICSKKLIELGIVRYCESCGLTKPQTGVHDRCEKCGEKYPFSNY